MSDSFIEKKYDTFHFGLRRDFDQRLLALLIAAIRKPALRRPKVLGGRGYIGRDNIEPLGPVIIKHYKRGGILRFLIARKYLRFGKVRPQIEFELLEKVRQMGIKAPEPVAWITQGGLFYRGWLITREIHNQKSLAEISLSDEERVPVVMKEFAGQIASLVRHRVFHVDLHPGNVLVDQDNNVFLLDFDKANFFKGNRNKLRDKYLCRWRRAVIKHNLPDVLSELMTVELRKNYEEK